jgi:hypothetical protein
MTTRIASVVIEITEDAYKQNSVYRPWEEIKASGVTAISRTSLTQRQILHVLATVAQEQTAAGTLG